MTVKVCPSGCLPREKCRSPEQQRQLLLARHVKNPIILMLLRMAARHRQGHRRTVADNKLVETGHVICAGLEDARWELLTRGL